MTITLLQPYGNYFNGASVTLDRATEAALVAQGRATYTSNPGAVFAPLTPVEQQALRDSGVASSAGSAAVQALVSGAGITGIPNAPLNVFAVAGEASARVYFRFSPGATSYTVTASPGGAAATGTVFPITVTGLTNGTSYTFTVMASVGGLTSAPSLPTNAVKPTALPAGITGIPGLMAWWDASQEAVVSNGTAVAAISDWSGNGYTASQATAGARPVYATAANWGGGATGKPAFKFDGAGTRLLSLLTSRLFREKPTLFVVLSFTSLTAGSGARDMRVLSNETTRFDEGWYLGTSTARQGGGGGTTCVNFGNSGGDSGSNYTTSPVVAINTPYIVSAVVGRQAFLNGIMASGFNGGTGMLGSIVPRNQGITIGSEGGSSANQPFNGSIAEVIWFGRQLTDAERYRVESYLATKYAMTAPTQTATLA